MTSATPSVTDFGQFADLRAGAAKNDPAVLREVAGQFEALFMQTILKNMRAAQLAEPMFGSDQHEMYLDMMDQQLAVEMSRGKGLGFADMLVRQLGGEADSMEPTVERFALSAVPPSSRAEAERDWSTPADFAREVWPHVDRVAKGLGIDPKALLAQAALETGWGQHVMRRADGSSSNNLFGIKAGSDWFGGSVVRKTVEFAGDVAQQVKARFRAYPDIAATFDDYAKLIGENPRYESVRGNGGDTEGFATALQEAGYATDPLYAAKIRRIAASETLRDAVNSLKPERALPIQASDTSKTVR